MPSRPPSLAAWAIITKHDADEGCTKLAQGGVCAVLDEHDSVEKHIQDTQVAGAFLNDESAVEAVCSEGAERVLELIEFWGGIHPQQGRLSPFDPRGRTLRPQDCARS